MTGGGTAGHILAALEILAAYRSEFGCEGVFIGSEAGFESRLARERGERVELIRALPWARQPWRGRVRAILSLGRAYLAARRVLVREGTELVIGTGGYASLAPCLAGWVLGLPVVIHEANAIPGLANRVLARVARLICVDCEETVGYLGTGRAVVVTGTPCCALPRARGSVLPPFRLIVLGGSEGSPWLNRRVPALFAELRRRGLEFAVHHLTGMEDPAPTQGIYDAAGVPARVEGWVTDMNTIYNGATLAIACPGARTLAELSEAGIPCVLTPLPGIAHGHHTVNARHFAGQTGARFVGAEEWDTAELAGWIEGVLRKPDALRAMAENMRKLARPNAAAAIVRAAESLLCGA